MLAQGVSLIRIFPHKNRIFEDHTGIYRSEKTRIQAYFVGNKVNGRISKRVLQENKASQIFRKTIISYPLLVFWLIWRALFFCNTRFEIHSFALLPRNWSNVLVIFQPFVSENRSIEYMLVEFIQINILNVNENGLV